MSYQIFIRNLDCDYLKLSQNDIATIAKNLGFPTVNHNNVQDFENALDDKYQDFKFFVYLDNWYGEDILDVSITVNRLNYKDGNENANYRNVVNAVADFKNDNGINTLLDVVDENGKKTTV